jgi:ribonuclease HI
VVLLEAMKIASNRGFDRVVFESDSQILVNAIYSNVQGSSHFTVIVSCKSFQLHFEVKRVRRKRIWMFLPLQGHRSNENILFNEMTFTYIM